MGRNNLDFQGITFDHGFSEDKKHIVVTATHPKLGVVGASRFSMHNNLQIKESRVQDIYVKKDFRRKGIGTGMWNHAVSLGINPKHSDERTALGEVFAQGVGGNGSKDGWYGKVLTSEELNKKVAQEMEEKGDYGLEGVLNSAKKLGIKLDKPI